MRYTQKDVEAAFERLARLLGKQTGDPWEKDSEGRLRSKVGTWTLDKGFRGMYRVEEIFNDGGGVSTPLGEYRYTAGEFIAAVYFAERVLEQYQKAQGAIPEAQGYPVPVR